MIKDTKVASDHLIFEDGAGGDVDALALIRNDDDGTLECHVGAQVDVTRDRQVVELNDG